MTSIYHFERAGAFRQYRFDYHTDLIDALKVGVAKRLRRWDPEEEAWVVSGEFEIFERILHRWGFQPCAECLTQFLRPPPPPPGAQRTDLDVLFLKPGAPPSLIDAAYRSLSKIYHPDLGGSNEKMKELNLAYERCKR